MGYLKGIGIGIGALVGAFFVYAFVMAAISTHESALEEVERQFPEKEARQIPDAREIDPAEVAELRSSFRLMTTNMNVLLKSCEDVGSASEYRFFKTAAADYDIVTDSVYGLLDVMADLGADKHPQLSGMYDNLDEKMLELDTCMRTIDLKYS